MTLGERYRVVSTLARGGTSIVYLCDDLRLPGARWAVKVADPTGLGPGASCAELFDREAELLAGLAHPALPRLVDRFQHEGLPALVLEVLPGETLAERLSRGPLPRIEGLRLARTLIELLERLHAQSVLLGDLSPANLILSPDGRIRLVDLGLARRGPGPVAGGTPGFTAPEAAVRAEPASDVYSLAALLRSCGLQADLQPFLAARPNDRPSLETLRRNLRGRARADASIPGTAVAAALVLLALSILSLTAALQAPSPAAEPPSGAAWRALQAGDRARAAGLARALLERDPTDPEARILLQNASLTGPARHLALVVPVTGPEAPEGKAFLQGAALAQEQSPQPLYLQVCDDGGQVQRAMSWVEELGRDERVPCVLGPTNSERSLAVEWVAARAGIPVLSLAASHPGAWQSNGWLFTVGVPFEPRVAPLARDFRARGFQRGFLLYDPQQVMARDLAFSLKSELGPVRELTCPTQTRDFGALVSTLVKERADGVFFVAAPGSYLGEFAVELRRAGSQAALYSNVAGYDEGLHRAGGQALEGLRLSESFTPRAERPEVRSFVTRFEELFPGCEPGRSAAQAFDAVRLASEPRDRAGLRERWQHLGRDLPAYPGVSGAVSTGRMPENVRVYLMEVRSGREELLREDPEPARADVHQDR